MDKGLELLLKLRENGLEFDASSGKLNVGIKGGEFIVYPSVSNEFFTYVLDGSWMVKDVDNVCMQYDGNGLLVNVYSSDFGSREGFEMHSVVFEKYKAEISERYKKVEEIKEL